MKKKRILRLYDCSHVPLHGLESIWRDGQPVGFLRRGEYAFALGKSIGYGYVSDPLGGVVNNQFLKSGTYQIEKMGDRYEAQIYVQSPFDPKNYRVKGQYDIAQSTEAVRVT